MHQASTLLRPGAASRLRSSTPAICTFASHLLAGNRRADKTMRPARRGACAPVSVTQHPSAAAEAEWLAAEVARLWLEERVPHSDVCVLLRCLRLQGGEPHGPLVQALRRWGH